MLLAVGYLLTGVGVTVGYHRLFTHRAFQTKQWVRWTFAILGSMAVEGPVLAWVADHRKHHQFSDVEGDPHSPHVGGGNGFVRRGEESLPCARRLAVRRRGPRGDHEVRARPARRARHEDDQQALRRVARDLAASCRLRSATRSSGTWQGALTALLWGGAIRIFLLHHVTFSINSICHFWGRRNFQSSDESRNVWLLSLISFGESWHNNHHAFPSSAFHGMRALRGRARSGRLGDHRAREARARVEGRAHPARAAGLRSRSSPER